jgi:hypothetical protein
LLLLLLFVLLPMLIRIRIQNADPELDPKSRVMDPDSAKNFGSGSTTQLYVPFFFGY